MNLGKYNQHQSKNLFHLYIRNQSSSALEGPQITVHEYFGLLQELLMFGETSQCLMTGVFIETTKIFIGIDSAIADDGLADDLHETAFY